MAKSEKLLRMSRVAPKKNDAGTIDSVASAKRSDDCREFHLLMEAQHYWSLMDGFRRNRERNKRYNYGDQWGDVICVDGETMTEEEYIKRQGNIPFKNNLIRKNTRRLVSMFRGQNTEPVCVARDRDEQETGETMSVILQYNMQLNRRKEVDTRTYEDMLFGGLAVHRKWFGWRNDRLDCWTDYVNPNNFFIDNKMRDFRGWDVSMLGEAHDVTFGELCNKLARSHKDYKRLREIYRFAADRNNIVSHAAQFGYSSTENFDFLLTTDPGVCRVIEIWRKEQKPRYRCVDPQNGDVYKIDIEDYEEIAAENEERLRLAESMGMPREDVPLIELTWFVDDYWYFYMLSPFGDILDEGETPYEHKGHPYVFKAYPFIDGEIHPYVGDFIDQQRLMNRMIILFEWIVKASAKGALMVPEDCLNGSIKIEDIAENWAKVDGVILYSPGPSGKVPQQIANNSTNVGIIELLNLQLKMFDDISSVTDALQGRPSFSGESAAHYRQQVENANLALSDLVETFNEFIIDGAYKDVKNMQQFYDSKRVFNIKGKSDSRVVYDPKKIRDVEFDLSITESTASQVYRQYANETLMQLFNANAITVEQLLEHGEFKFADKLLQSIKAQKEQLQNGQMPDAMSPELMKEVQQGANMDAVSMLYNNMRAQ